MFRKEMKIESNRLIALDTYEMVLEGDLVQYIKTRDISFIYKLEKEQRICCVVQSPLQTTTNK